MDGAGDCCNRHHGDADVHEVEIIVAGGAGEDFLASVRELGRVKVEGSGRCNL